MVVAIRLPSRSCARALRRVTRAVILELLLKLTMYDIAIYVVQRTHPSLHTTAGDIHFDPHLDRIPRAAPAAFFMLYGGTRARGFWAWTMVWTPLGGHDIASSHATIICLGYDRGNRLSMVSFLSSRIFD